MVIVIILFVLFFFWRFRKNEREGKTVRKRIDLILAILLAIIALILSFVKWVLSY